MIVASIHYTQCTGARTLANEYCHPVFQAYDNYDPYKPDTTTVDHYHNTAATTSDYPGGMDQQGYPYPLGLPSDLFDNTGPEVEDYSDQGTDTVTTFASSFAIDGGGAYDQYLSGIGSQFGEYDTVEVTQAEYSCTEEYAQTNGCSFDTYEEE
jgi:hypothetical protein